jgi:hypothetical protein
MVDQADPNTNDCQPCGAGRYAPTPGQFECSDCPAGRFSNTSALSSCYDCAVGRAQAATGSTACDICRDGKFQPNPAQSSCVSCIEGEYMRVSSAAYSSWLSGVPLVASCAPCVDHALCTGSSIYAERDYYLVADDSGAVTATRCPDGFCNAANSDACNAEQSVQNSSVIGATGIASASSLYQPEWVRSCCANARLPASAPNALCGRCEADHSEWGGACVACTHVNGGLLAAFLLVSLLWIMVLHVLSQQSSADVRILLFYLQLLALVCQNGSGYFSWLSLFDLNAVSAVGDSQSSNTLCPMPVDALQKLLLGIYVPLINVALLLLVFALHGTVWLYARSHPDRCCGRALPSAFVAYVWPSGAKHHKSPYIRTAFGLFVSLVNPVTLTAFQFFSCTALAPGTRVVTAAPAIDCDSASYKSALAGVWLVFCAVVIVFPLVLVFLLLRAWRGGRLHSDEKFRLRYGITFEVFRPSFFLWEAQIVARRVLLVALVVFVPRPTSYALVSLCLLIFLFMQLTLAPYAAAEDNRNETASLLGLGAICTLLTGAAFPLSAGYALLITLIALGPIVWLTVAIVRRRWPKLRRVLAAVVCCCKSGRAPMVPMTPLATLTPQSPTPAAHVSVDHPHASTASAAQAAAQQPRALDDEPLPSPLGVPEHEQRASASSRSRAPSAHHQPLP